MSAATTPTAFATTTTTPAPVVTVSSGSIVPGGSNAPTKEINTTSVKPAVINKNKTSWYQATEQEKVKPPPIVAVTLPVDAVTSTIAPSPASASAAPPSAAPASSAKAQHLIKTFALTDVKMLTKPLAKPSDTAQPTISENGGSSAATTAAAAATTASTAAAITASTAAVTTASTVKEGTAGTKPAQQPQQQHAMGGSITHPYVWEIHWDGKVTELKEFLKGYDKNPFFMRHLFDPTPRPENLALQGLPLVNAFVVCIAPHHMTKIQAELASQNRTKRKHLVEHWKSVKPLEIARAWLPGAKEYDQVFVRLKDRYMLSTNLQTDMKVIRRRLEQFIVMMNNASIVPPNRCTYKHTDDTNPTMMYNGFVNFDAAVTLEKRAMVLFLLHNYHWADDEHGNPIVIGDPALGRSGMIDVTWARKKYPRYNNK